MPKAHNNNDRHLEDVGLATTGGRELAQLAQVMFKAAQATKPDHCNWQLIGQFHYTAWITMETNIHCPIPAAQAPD